jgi:hypothetical protein
MAPLTLSTWWQQYSCKNINLIQQVGENATDFKVSTYVAQEWNVTDRSRNEYQHRTSEDHDGTEGRHRQERGRQSAVFEVFADLPPGTGCITL